MYSAASASSRWHATVLCVALGTGGLIGQSRKVLTELGRVIPPAYAAPLIRTGDPSPEFDAAIEAYARRQYGPAADALRRFITAEPEDQAANFFLAVALMMIDDVGEAEDRLRAVLAGDETPFHMPARFVLGKALIRLGRLTEAEQQLMRVADSRDPLARAAGELVPKIRAVAKEK
ncbi:MAG TPA: tetratricopeptide repeat protein [Vicinamibacterales bacterium]|jgi:predicted Zn-dependent protease|nr:tetratricopeptide repeat protein [Vicinamibacterales bacterium]